LALLTSQAILIVFPALFTPKLFSNQVPSREEVIIFEIRSIYFSLCLIYTHLILFVLLTRPSYSNPESNFILNHRQSSFPEVSAASP